MTDQPLPLHEIGDLVTAGLPDGTWVSGRVFSYEDGRNLGHRFGGPWPGRVYEIEREGDSPGCVRVAEEAMESLEDLAE